MCLVVSHSNSTSNHNGHANEYIFAVLFLIPILHQTTTLRRNVRFRGLLFLIPILHQTTTFPLSASIVRSCFSFQFYIKPQPCCSSGHGRMRCFSFQFYIKPQPPQLPFCFFPVVSHSNSTSNHNLSNDTDDAAGLFLIPILHQTTTHISCPLCLESCFSFQFYIKPQPRAWQ